MTRSERCYVTINILILISYGVYPSSLHPLFCSIYPNVPQQNYRLCLTCTRNPSLIQLCHVWYSSTSSSMTSVCSAPSCSHGPSVCISAGTSTLRSGGGLAHQFDLPWSNDKKSKKCSKTELQYRKRIQSIRDIFIFLQLHSTKMVENSCETN